jgi:hypothetical protein
MRTTLNKLLALGAQQVEITLPELDLCQVWWSCCLKQPSCGSRH